MQDISDRKRLLKRTGFLVSELGLGAWGIGGRGAGQTTRIEARETVQAYIEAGGNFIDTAIGYGESEQIIGSVLKDHGSADQIYICTKSKSGEFADTVAGLRKDLETSLRNLNREHVDIFYLHWPPETDEVIELALCELERLKGEGKIRAIGASIKGPAVTDETVALCKKYVDTNRVDVIQMVYSILRQKNEASMAHAFSHDVGVVVRTSLESGFLTGKYGPGTRFGPDDHRSRWNSRIDGIIPIVEDIRQKHLDSPYANLSQLAIQFALYPREVTNVIVGAKNVAQLEANIDASLMQRMDRKLFEELRKEFGDFTENANPEL